MEKSVLYQEVQKLKPERERGDLNIKEWGSENDWSLSGQNELKVQALQVRGSIGSLSALRSKSFEPYRNEKAETQNVQDAPQKDRGVQLRLQLKCRWKWI